MIPIVGVSLEEALLGFGDDGESAELHDKEVSLSTSDVTGSQTAIFVYNPANEDPSGTPPGPWDGYSLFTIDLSGVKEDIEELQQQVSDAEACRQQVISALQEYDPDYDPQSGECPASKVDDLVDDYETVSEEAEECNQCKSAVVAAIQEILPNFNPQTCQDMVDAVEEVYEKGEEEGGGYTFPPGVEVPDEVVTDIHTKLEDLDMPNTSMSYYAKIRTQDVAYGEYSYQYKTLTDKLYTADYQQYYAAAIFYIMNINGTEYNMGSSNGYGLKTSSSGSNWYVNIDTWDRETGEFDITVNMSRSWQPDNWSVWHSKTNTYSQIAGYGDSTHTNKVSNV